MHDQHVRRIHELGDRREILDRVVRQVLEQRRIDRDRGRGEQQRVAVRRRARHLPHADIAGGAAAVVDHDLLAERLATATVDRMRAMMSVGPPGANGTTSVIGRSG